MMTTPAASTRKSKGQNLGVTSFKYLGSVVSDKGPEPEILSRTAQMTTALTRLKPVWNNRSISLSSKIRLMRSHVVSIFLYACESWTLTAKLQRRIRAMEMRSYGMILCILYKDHVTNEEVSAKTKLMTNNSSGINTEIKINGQKLETVTSFMYLGSVITEEGSKPEILSRIARTTAALTRLKLVCNDKSISLSSKIRLMCSLVTSIFLYVCESWTLTAELQRRIPAMEMRCYRKILHISYKDHVTNEEVRAKIQQAIGPHEDLLTIVKRGKLQW